MSFDFAAVHLVANGPTRTSWHVRFSAAVGGEADISRRMQTDTIYENAPTPTNTPCSIASIGSCRNARTTAFR
jgi:hypothetical protein